MPKSLLVLALLLALPLTAPDSVSAQTHVPASVSGDILARDRRLNVRVSFEGEPGLRMEKALRLLSRRADVDLRIDPADNETIHQPVALRFQAAPLRDILRAVALVANAEWRRGERGTLLLRNRNLDRMADWHRPHSPAEVARRKAGREMASQLAQLPPDLRDALAQGIGNGRASVPLSQLPPAMQNAVRGFVSALNAHDEEKGTPARLDLDALEEFRISLAPNPNPNGLSNSFKVQLSDGHGGGGGYGVHFSDDPQEDEKITPQPVPGKDHAVWQAEYEKEMERLRERALTTDERLKRRYSLRMREAGFGKALSALLTKTGHDFARVDISLELDRRLQKTFSFVNLPLSDLLNRLTALYVYGDAVQKTRRRPGWSQSEQGTLLFYTALVDPITPSDTEATARVVANLFSALPRDLRNRLQDADGVPFRELPADFQTAARDFFSQNSAVSQKLETMNLRISMNYLSNGTGYTLWYGQPGGNWSGITLRSTR